VNSSRVVSGTIFYPRGGSAFVTRALARGLRDEGLDVTLIAGSRSDRGGLSDARSFYAGIDLHTVDYTAALGSADPMSSAGLAGTGPAHPSYEDRPGAADRVFAALDDADYQRQVDAWTRELRAVEAAGAHVLHLHHLTPLNAAAAIAAPDVPVVAQLHGTELLMLEAIEAGADWPYAAAWAGRLRAWAHAAEQIVVAPGNRKRALALLGVDPGRIITLPNGFDPTAFRPLDVDRRAVWRRVLVDEPRGWRPGEEPGSIRYRAADVDALDRGPVILYVGRFTEVKRLTLLLEAFADARALMAAPASLILVGGHPGEWEGEHPAETIDRAPRAAGRQRPAGAAVRPGELRSGDRRGDGLRRPGSRRSVAGSGADHRRRRHGLAVRRRRSRGAGRGARRCGQPALRARAARATGRAGRVGALHLACDRPPAREDPARRRAAPQSAAPPSYSFRTLTVPAGAASMHSRHSTHSSKLGSTMSSVPSAAWA